MFSVAARFQDDPICSCVAQGEIDAGLATVIKAVNIFLDLE